MRLLTLCSVLLVSFAVGQNLVPNGSFEIGEKSPEGWRLSGGVGSWENFGKTGKRSISVTGNGEDSNAWECTNWRPDSGKLYLIRCFVNRSPDSVGGTPITGFSTVNRDAWDVPSDGKWHPRQFICRTPVNRPDTVLRFGQWHVKGKVAFEDVEVLPAIAVHKRIGKVMLGTGESIRNGVYYFTSNFSGFGSNDAPTLFAHTAGFNTDRWVLGGPMSERWQESGAWVIYRHSVGFPLTSARLSFVIGYYESGQLVVEVSVNGKQWRELGRFSPTGEYTLTVPKDLFPTKELWVRFWSTGTLQVHHYRVEAPLSGNLSNAFGETWYFAVRKSAQQLAVEPVALTGEALLVKLKNNSPKPRRIEINLTASDRGLVKEPPAKRTGSRLTAVLTPHSEQVLTVPLPKLATKDQVVTLTVLEGGGVVFSAEAEVSKPWIEFGGFGYHIAETKAMSIWWCEATYKISPATPRPSPNTSRPIRIEEARNEYEPFQLILAPKASLKRLRLRLTDFKPSRSQSTHQCPIWDEIALVDYVPVTVPTDAWGAAGEYPDPLVPLWRRERWTPEGEKPQAVEVTVENLQANRNQPLWLTVFVPKGTPAGTYRATIQIVEAIDSNGKPIPTIKSSIPIELRVFDFTLPDDTPLRTAYGVGIDNDWHRLRTIEQYRRVWDLYMQICRRYRISPYTPHAYAPIKWEIHGPRTTVDNGLLNLEIDHWQGRVATVRAKLSSVDVVSVGGILPTLEQFEREGVGWEGKGIGWCGTEVIRDVQFVERNEQRVVMDITAERVSSAPANRKFSVTVRLIVEAGKPFVAVQLRRLVNTDTVRWQVRGYYHLLPPDLKPNYSVNTHRFGAWLISDASLVLGAAGEGFTYSVRINPQTGWLHGDVYRPVGKWLEPNEVWSPENEPIALVFVGILEQGRQDMRQQLTEFVDKLLRGETTSQLGAKVQVSERAEPEFQYDFTEFDEAMQRYIDGFRFNGFNLVILPQSLGGHEQFTPEWTALYKKLMAPILEHLQKKGWLKFAYCYWIDEPHTPEQYELTKRGMASLKEALPGVRRLLTNYTEKFPSPTFYGFVDLWVPIFNQFDPQRAKERQALGEEVWWYVCTGPKQPYPNNFIDHPAITHRIRYWMAAKWNLDGDLYWSMTYWRGKNWRLRNPYEDGQSETPEGGYFGNGDGRLLYPPVRQPLPEDTEPVIAPPIPSLRLALISEGIEDFCYLWLLRQLVEEGKKVQVKSGALQAALKQANEALGALDRLIRSQTDYETDPKKVYSERHRIAEAIERLANVLSEK